MSARVDHPGKILKERYLDPLEITPYKLAKAIGVHVRRVSELIKGHRKLTPDTAYRLGLYFKVPAKWWLDMQIRYDCQNQQKLTELSEKVSVCDKLDSVLITPVGVKFLNRYKQPKVTLNSLRIPKEFLNKSTIENTRQLETRVTGIQKSKYDDGSVSIMKK